MDRKTIILEVHFEDFIQTEIAGDVEENSYHLDVQ
jgi:hypothetical protein